MNAPSLDALDPVSSALLKWTCLLAASWLAHAWLRHRDARWRLVLWRSILCLGLVLPWLPLISLPTLKIPVSSLELAARPTSPTPSLITAGNAQPASPAPRIQALPTGSKATGSSAAPSQGLWFSGIHLLVWVWGLGFACAAVRLILLTLQVTRLRTAAPLADAAITELAHQFQEELGVPRPIKIHLSNQTLSPFVCGIFRPAIILPQTLLPGLASAHLSALLRHEIAHLRRQDLAWNLGWRWLQAACWFHPLVWFVPSAHSLACEQEADRLASGGSENRASYARALAQLTLRVVAPPTVETELTLNGTAQIVRRLDHLSSGKLGGWTRRHRTAAYALAGLLIVLSNGWELSQNRGAAMEPSAPNESKQLLVIVQDEEGKPLEGALVEPYAFRVVTRSADHYGWERSKRFQLPTDAEGKAYVTYPVEAFPAERLRTAQISVTIKHADYSPCVAHLSVDGMPVPIRLTPGIQMQVVGFTKGGPGHETVREQVSELVPMLSGEPTVVWRETSPGVMACSQIAPGRHLLQVMGRSSNGEMVFSEAVALSFGDAGKVPTIEDDDTAAYTIQRGKPLIVTANLKPGIRLEGHLDSRVPRPVTHGRVVVNVRPKQIPALLDPNELGKVHERYGRFQYWTSYRPIAEDGTFVFESVPPGEVDVLVHGEGFVSKKGGEPKSRASDLIPLVIGVPQSFALRAPATKIEVKTESTAALDVTVQTKDGRPVEGAQVYVYPNVLRMQTGIFGAIDRSSEAPFRDLEPLSSTPPDYSRRSDKNGRVVLRNLPATTRLLDVEHPDYVVPLPKTGPDSHPDRTIRFQLVPGQTKKLTLTLQPKGLDHLGEQK